MGTDNKSFYYIALTLMASTFLPLVFNNLPPVIRSQHFYAIVWGLSLLFFRPGFLFTKSMVYIFAYGLFIVLATASIWSDMDEWNKRMLFQEYYEVAIGISIFSYFHNIKDYSSIAKITKWSIFFLFITAIMTIISAAIDPMYARNFSTKSIITESEYESVLQFKRYGGGTYGTAGAFMGLFPVIIYYYKHIHLSLISKKQIIVFAVLISVALLSMQIFANILIALLFSMIALIGMKNIKKTYFISIILITVIFITPKQVYIDSLYSIGNLMGNKSELKFKFTDMAKFLETGSDIDDKSTAVASRVDRYPMLMASFEKSPFFGCYFFSGKYGNGYNSEGGHLHWMNKLTVTGIIGLMLFLYIPIRFMRKNLLHFNSTYKFYYILASLSILSYGLMKTIAGRDTWYTFFIIIPGLFYLPLLKRKDEFIPKLRKSLTKNKITELKVENKKQ